ncbi:MAG: hypothetical protein M0Q43_10560 [Methanothrix sp.]|jgi:hypothetical protein|nr:hypothetical protein [Methanothrix sp.]
MKLILFEKLGAFITRLNQEILKLGFKMMDGAYASANFSWNLHPKTKTEF